MEQPIITKKPAVKTVLINFLISIIPIGFFYVLIKAILDTIKTRMPIYKTASVKVSDKRYSSGSRIVRSYNKRTGKKRELSMDEKRASKYNGKLRLYGVILFLIFGGILYYRY